MVFTVRLKIAGLIGQRSYPWDFICVYGVPFLLCSNRGNGMDVNNKAAWLSIVSNLILTVGKLIIGMAIQSVSVISEAIHSGVDLLASFVALFAVKSSSKPPDHQHPYGHGKIENVSGTIEALLIFLAAVLIIKEAISKIIHPQEFAELGWGIAVMGVSALVNLIVALYEIRVGRSNGSVALEADGMHHMTDVYTSLGVFAGLILIQITQVKLVDPITAILVACLILKAAWDLTVKAFAPLMDTSMDRESIMLLETILAEYHHSYFEYHELRTRKAGRESYIDLHLVVHPAFTIQEAHELCDAIEGRIEEAIVHSHVMIHVEPAETDEP